MPPETGRDREVADWLRKAKHDLDAATLIADSDPTLTDVICFHAQQTVEKSFKAFLVSNAVVAPRTHDLSICLQRCAEIDKDFFQFEDAADVLTPYAVASRYPDDFCDYPIEDAKEALALANEIHVFVKNKVVHE